MSGRRHLGYTFSLRQAFGDASLLAGVLLLGNLALMFLVLKLVYSVSGANLGNIKISHLLSAHIGSVLRFIVRLLPCKANC
jgi:hypothetical protein